MATERTVKVGVEGDRKFFFLTFEKGGIGNIGGLHKIRGLALLCQLCKETLKFSHPPL